MKKSAALIILGLGIAFTSCSKPAAQTTGDATAAEKHLIVAVNPDFETFDPALAYEPFSAWVLGTVYDTLYKYKNDIRHYEPQLAESYTVSPDGLTYTYTLRKDVTFNTGRPLTSADLLWSNQRALNMKGNATFNARGIAGIEAPDDYTIVYHLKEADPTFHIKLASNLFAPLDRQAAEEHGATNAENADTTDSAKVWLDNNSIGTGPYQIASYTPKVDLVMERNPNYWGTKPYYDKITLKSVTDSNSQAMMLRAGDVDIAFNLSPEQIRELQGINGISIMDAPSLRFSFLLMNRDPAVGGPVANPTVQKAIHLALDYKGLQTIAGGGVVTPQGPFSLGLTGSFPPADVSGYPKLAEAKALMAQAGYAEGFSSKFYVPVTNIQGVDFVILAQKIQNDLAAIGITTELVPENVTISLESYRNGKQPLGLWHWGPDYNDNISNLAFLPGNTVALRAGWKAEANSALANLGRNTALEIDEAKRIEYLRQIQEQLLEDSPFAVILQHASQYAIRTGLTGADFGINRLDFTRLAE